MNLIVCAEANQNQYEIIHLLLVEQLDPGSVPE